MDENYKIIEFENFCGRCIHRDDPENSDACDECLSEPARYETHVPLNFKNR